MSSLGLTEFESHGSPAYSQVREIKACEGFCGGRNFLRMRPLVLGMGEKYCDDCKAVVAKPVAPIPEEMLGETTPEKARKRYVRDLEKQRIRARVRRAAKKAVVDLEANQRIASLIADATLYYRNGRVKSSAKAGAA